jgi:hypothetical protein
VRQKESPRCKAFDPYDFVSGSVETMGMESKGMGNRTYFEQVPLDAVMKLLEEMPNSEEGVLATTDGIGKHRVADQRTRGNQVMQACSAAKEGSHSQENEIEGGELKYPGWQAALREVILEFNREKLAEKAQQVEMLMAERLQQLRERDDRRDEQEAIRYALSVLRGIKRDKLGYPDWQ